MYIILYFVHGKVTFGFECNKPIQLSKLASVKRVVYYHLRPKSYQLYSALLSSTQLSSLTDMVAQRIKKSKAPTPALPATPNRKVPDPDTLAWIHAWLCGFTAAIASKADDLTPKLDLLGFNSFDSLQYMNNIDDLRAIGLTNAHAQMLMKDAKALHTQASSSPSVSPIATPPDRDTDKEKRFIAWSGKLEGIPGGPHNCTRPELLRWLTALLCFIEAQCFALGVHVREFCKDPGMLSPDFLQLQAKISPWQHRQLAAVIVSSIPAAMAQHLASMIPDGLLAADG